MWAVHRVELDTRSARLKSKGAVHLLAVVDGDPKGL